MTEVPTAELIERLRGQGPPGSVSSLAADRLERWQRLVEAIDRSSDFTVWHEADRLILVDLVKDSLVVATGQGPTAAEAIASLVASLPEPDR